MASSTEEEITTTEDEDSMSDITENIELQVLKESIQGKAKNTISAYLRAYYQLTNALAKEVHASSQKLIIEKSREISDNLNTQAQLINMGIVMRRLYNLDVKELESQRKTNKKGIVERVKQQNQKLNEVLPTLAEFDEHLTYLHSKQMYPELIVNYLIRHLCVRNQDMVFELVKRKADVKNDKKNYMWLAKGKATYYRRDYKTADTYKEKINVIKDKAFLNALAKVKFPLISNPSNVGYFVKKMSFKELGEGSLVKIVVNDAREKGDLNELTRISKDRGTDLCTIATSYNIQPKKNWY